MISTKYLSQYMITACKRHPEYGRSITYKSISEGVGPAIRISAHGQDYDFRFSQSPFNEDAAVDLVINKEKAQKVLSPHILMPETRIFSKSESLADIAASIRSALDIGALVYPLVVKPNHESLSLGVFVAWDDKELADSLNRCADISRSSNSILVQEYIPSDIELRVMFFEGEVMGVINKNLADIERTRAGSGVEDEWGQASLIQDEELDERLSEIIRFLDEQHGLVYGGLDIRVDSRSGDLYLLEANPAPMGYEILEYNLAGGQEMIECITSRMLDKIFLDSLRALNLDTQPIVSPDAG